MQAPPPGRRASRHRRGFRSEGSPCADESTVALRLSTPAGELRIRVRQCAGMSPEGGRLLAVDLVSWGRRTVAERRRRREGVFARVHDLWFQANALEDDSLFDDYLEQRE